MRGGTTALGHQRGRHDLGVECLRPAAASVTPGVPQQPLLPRGRLQQKGRLAHCKQASMEPMRLRTVLLRL